MLSRIREFREWGHKSFLKSGLKYYSQVLGDKNLQKSYGNIWAYIFM